MTWIDTTLAQPRVRDLPLDPGRTSRLQRIERARAAVLVEPEFFVIHDVELHELSPSHVRVRLEGCGVCASNLSPWEGRPWFEYPFPPGNPGHEAWGVVQAVGDDVYGVSEGDRVTLLGERAYATHADVDATKVVILPDVLDGRPFPGEPLACAFNVLTRCHVEPGQRVAIVGIGFMGAVLTALCREAGAEVIALSRRRSSLAAAERMGAHTCVTMDDHEGVIRRISELTDGELCDCVIECAGAQWPLDLASALTRVRGRLVVAGYHQDGPRQVDMQLWNWRGLDVVNAHERDDARHVLGMRRAVAAVAEGRLDPFDLLTHSFPLEDIDEAFEVTRSRPEGFVKAVLRYA
jgi:threonine dehydrogenase-like Zn-dependent dehydrogenase